MRRDYDDYGYDDDVMPLEEWIESLDEAASNLHSSNYECLDEDSPNDSYWSREISNKIRRCRRDHKDGTIKKGDRYFECIDRTIKLVDGVTQSSKITRRKTLIPTKEDRT